MHTHQMQQHTQQNDHRDRSFSPSTHNRGGVLNATGPHSNFGTAEGAAPVEYTYRLAYSPSNNSSAPHDYDPYAPAIVQDLLHGTNEWKNIQDIVKLTFKAVCDVVRSQGMALRELERTMPTKCNKAELNAGLSLKANVSDVSRTVAEVASNIENKMSFEDMQ